MAVEPFKSFSTCIAAVDNARGAIERGNADQAARILKSVGADAKILKIVSKTYHQKLQVIEKQQDDEILTLTSEINKVHEDEQNLEGKKLELTTNKQTLILQKERENESLKDAQESRQIAQRLRDEAQDRYNTFRSYRWVPVVGLVLFIREKVKDYEGQARQAQRDMDCYQNKYQESEREIERLEDEISKVEEGIKSHENEIQSLNQQRKDLHEQLESTKKYSVFILKACTFWEELSSLSDHVSDKTKLVERLMRVAAQRDTLNILRNRGNQTIARSFEDSWMEIRDMFLANDPGFVVEIREIPIDYIEIAVEIRNKLQTDDHVNACVVDVEPSKRRSFCLDRLCRLYYFVHG